MVENIVKQEIVMEYLVKFVPIVILIEKTHYDKKSLMKILGIGNAIVDVICKINDDFISKNNLTKER